MSSDDRVKVRYNDSDWPIAGCDCHGCGNFFFYVDLPEYAPRMCCYCGLKFIRYADPEGVVRTLNGLTDDQEGSRR